MKLTAPQALLLHFIILNGTTTKEATTKANLSFVPITGLRKARLVHTAYHPSGAVTIWLTNSGNNIAEWFIKRKGISIKPDNVSNEQFLVSLLNSVGIKYKLFTGCQKNENCPVYNLNISPCPLLLA
jgi:hypothetical protein